MNKSHHTHSFCEVKPKKELANQTRGPITFLSLAAAAAVFGGLLFYYENEKDKTIRKVTREVITVGENNVSIFIHCINS